LSGSDRVASNKESRNLTGPEIVFLNSSKSPTSVNYQSYKIITVKSKVIIVTFQLNRKTKINLFFVATHIAQYMSEVTLKSKGIA
jgi:hypothetical protein